MTVAESRGNPQDEDPQDGDPQELGRVLREATRLIENADLRGASETLEKAREVAALHCETSDAVTYPDGGEPAHDTERQRSRAGGMDHAG